MPMMHIILDVDDPADRDRRLAKIKDKKLIHSTGDITAIRVPRGMDSGKSSVMFEFELPDGSIAIQETSMDLFLGGGESLCR